MPLEASAEPCIPDLEKTLLDTKLPLFQRYRAMFGLRDLASPPDLPTAVDAINALAKGLKDPSALFRHEVAFVFGQLCHPASIPSLTASLSDLSEVGMVRHEAAEALGSLGEEDGGCLAKKKRKLSRDGRDFNTLVPLVIQPFSKNRLFPTSFVQSVIPRLIVGGFPVKAISNCRAGIIMCFRGGWAYLNPQTHL